MSIKQKYFHSYFVRDTEVYSKLVWNADIFVFKILLQYIIHPNRKVFCSFPIVKEYQSAAIKIIAG